MSGSGTEISSADRSPLDRIGVNLDEALTRLESCEPFARSRYQNEVFQLAEVLLRSEDGLRQLWERAPRFDAAGVFADGPWEHPAKLQPTLVVGSLQATGVYPVVEVLSELRMLSLAMERSTSAEVTAEEARDFLGEVMALNLEYVFPTDSEEERLTGGPHRDAALRLFAMLADHLGLGSLLEDVVHELEQITAQRPIMTKRAKHVIRMAARLPEDVLAKSPVADRLAVFSNAVAGPGAISRSAPDLARCRTAYRSADEAALVEEIAAIAESVERTGLVAEQHAVLLRQLVVRHPELLPSALGLSDAGRASYEAHAEQAKQLIKAAIFPSTAQSIVGLRGVLERGLLSRQEVKAGLERLVDLDLRPAVKRALLERQERRQDGVTANSILLSGALSVLGQPLGIGQGRNPTCQAARGMSLWSQHAPGYLLELVLSAGRDGHLAMDFEGQRIATIETDVSTYDLDLDPVSIVLVPHLDRLYAEMMKRVALRAEDGHKWVNPALYGRFVPKGFASVFSDATQTAVIDHKSFVRLFWATHHPAYNDDHSLMYPNPVGICVTSGHGDYLGPHAVSLLRVADDPNGKLRAYFFNPNNEGRQDWGLGVHPSVSGNGERQGESSLPFEQFTARLYAFHYNPYEEGDAYAVPGDTVARISEAAQESWGRSFRWVA